jgi:uncharacterized lipoprotein YmbA
MKRTLVHCALLFYALAACRSAPSQYYTLVAPPTDAASVVGNALQLDILPVDVPPDVDRAQMVVRLGSGQVAPADTRSWIAPLPLEIRRALSDELVLALGARDIAGVTPAVGMPVYRIKVNIQRFESALGDRALIDAVWSVREASGTTAQMTCSTRASEPAPGDYEGLAEAHQRALAKIAAAIAAGVRGLAADGNATCAK